MTSHWANKRGKGPSRHSASQFMQDMTTTNASSSSTSSTLTTCGDSEARLEREKVGVAQMKWGVALTRNEGALNIFKKRRPPLSLYLLDSLSLSFLHVLFFLLRVLSFLSVKILLGWCCCCLWRHLTGIASSSATHLLVYIYADELRRCINVSRTSEEGGRTYVQRVEWNFFRSDKNCELVW